MMFTTPAMASEPYTAEAPSFRISMRSIAAVGMEFRSTDVFAPVPPGTMRRPLRSTRVRSEPRPRDRKSTRLNSSHTVISYAVFCLKKKKKKKKKIKKKKKKDKKKKTKDKNINI